MIALSKKAAYLVLDSKDPSKRRFSVCETLEEVLKKWNSTTRFSRAHPLGSREILSEPFAGAWQITFFGPCHPFDFVRHYDPATAAAWLTIGLYNIFLPSSIALPITIHPSGVSGNK